MQSSCDVFDDEVFLLSDALSLIQSQTQMQQVRTDDTKLYLREGVLAPEYPAQMGSAPSIRVMAVMDLLTSDTSEHSLSLIFTISVIMIALFIVGRAAIKNAGSLTTQVQGTLLIVASAMTFSVVALMIKRNPLPTAWAVQARFLISWGMCSCFMLRYRSEHALNWFGPVEIRWRLVLRGCLTYAFVMSWWAALPRAPLGDCTAIVYCGPLLTNLLSRVVVGERVSVFFPVQAVLALAGMCLIVQPQWLVRSFGLSIPSASDDTMTGYQLVTVAMIIVAFIPVVTFQTKTASWIEVEHVTCFLASFVFNPVAICFKYFADVEPVAEHVFAGVGKTVFPVWAMVIIVVAALGSFLAESMQTRGYQIAEPGKAVMFRYLEIPCSYLLQCVATDNPISLSAGIGAILTVLSCLLGAIAQIRSSREDSNLEAIS